MTAIDIISEASNEGLHLSLSETGKIILSGERAVVEKWVDIVKEHKEKLIVLLNGKAGEKEKDTETCHMEDMSKTGKPLLTPSPIALQWLHAHRSDLRQAGWKAPELYRRNKSKGLAWMSLWDRTGITVSLSPGGTIFFQYINGHGLTIRQTARMMHKK